jgi:branched-chain amino acid transport system substrate-binding protein
MTPRWMTILFGVLLASAAGAAPGDKTDVVRDLAGRVGPIVGSALACGDIARPRIRVIVDKFAAVIKEASSNEAERDDLTHLLDRNVADGRGAVTAGKIDCRLPDRQLADLERSIVAPTLAAAIAPSSAAAATAPAAPAVSTTTRGVSDR